MPKSAVKVLLNLALIATESLVRGGTMEVGGEDNDGHLEIVVKVEGGRIVLDPEIRRTLVEGAGEQDVTPRAAAAYMINTLVRGCRRYGDRVRTGRRDHDLRRGVQRPDRDVQVIQLARGRSR